MNLHTKSSGGCTILSEVEVQFRKSTEGSNKVDLQKYIFSAPIKLSEGAKRKIHELCQLADMQGLAFIFSMKVHTGSPRGKAVAKARGTEFFEIMELKLAQLAATIKPAASVDYKGPTPKTSTSDFIQLTPTSEEKKMELLNRFQKK